MSTKTTLKPLAVAMGTAIVTSLAGTPAANAADNPFAMADLSSGYMVAESSPMEGKCGAKRMMYEGICGGAMMKDGQCGMMMRLDSNGDGKISKEEFMKGHQAMFDSMDTNHDGVVDSDEMKAQMKMMSEGKCGAGKMDKEGKCGGSK
jgi:uncharacterized low-complexity protein